MLTKIVDNSVWGTFMQQISNTTVIKSTRFIEKTSRPHYECRAV